MRSIAVIAVAGIILAAAGAACSDEQTSDKSVPTTASDQVEPTNTAALLEATNTATVPAPTNTAQPREPTATPAPSVSYNIAQREDVSFGSAVRIVYRVSVSGTLTESELRRIAQEIIDEETSEQDVNVIGFFFYLPGSDTQDIYTAGKADWAPNGDWASADTVETGDYSRHKLVLDLGGP